MQALEFGLSCPECLKPYLDLDDEFVCPGCGATREKEVLPGVSVAARAAPSGAQALGSYMGSRTPTREERLSTGLSGSNSSYAYMKVVSDYAGRREGPDEVCAKMVERVGEKLGLPSFVRAEAVAISKKVLATPHPGRRVTLGAVSAYAIISACKVGGVASVSVREIIGAHGALGRHVTSSSIIRLTLDSPTKTYARVPQDYVSRVLARLSTNDRLRLRLEEERVSAAAYVTSLRSTALELLGVLGEEARAGRRPCALAAAAVYSAETVLSLTEGRRKRLTQRELAECGDTAEYTVREQCAVLFSPAVGVLLARRSQTPPLEQRN